MKKTSFKIAALLVAAVILSLSSFTFKKYGKAKHSITFKEEYGEVLAFVSEKIVTPISKSRGTGNMKMSAFSRCPSGYQSRLAGDYDSAKVDRFVFGKVRLYKGCSGNNVCDFKVCVNKNIALVRTDDTEEFVTVKDWLNGKRKKELL